MDLILQGAGHSGLDFNLSMWIVPMKSRGLLICLSKYFVGWSSIFLELRGIARTQHSTKKLTISVCARICMFSSSQMSHGIWQLIFHSSEPQILILTWKLRKENLSKKKKNRTKQQRSNNARDLHKHWYLDKWVISTFLPG